MRRLAAGSPRLFPIAVTALVLIGCGSSGGSDPAPAAPEKVAKAETPQPAGEPKKVGRVTVEHGLDGDVSKVNLRPQPITVEDLLAIRDQVGKTADLDANHDRRIGPFETTTFEVEGTIKNIKHEKDGDFYLVLQGKSGAQAVVEVPDPKLCIGSPLLSKIRETRDALDSRYKPTDTPKDLNEKITIDGVGFFGSKRKAGSGGFGSSVRLMPGTGVKFEK